MKNVSIVLVAVSAVLLSGCSGRNLNDYDRAAILGASEKQALENAQAQYPVEKAQSAHKPVKHDQYFKQVSAEAEATINGTISDGASFLIGQGWKAKDGKWHKQGYILTLVVEDGIVVNAQLTR